MIEWDIYTYTYIEFYMVKYIGMHTLEIIGRVIMA